MGRRGTLLPSVAILAAFGAACGGTAPEATTAPSAAVAPFPSVLGRWTGAASVSFVNRTTGSRMPGYTCGGNWGVTSQQDGEFSGWSHVSGSGANSDPYCSHSGNFSGVMTRDGQVTGLVLIPWIGSRGCAHIAGERSLTGAFADGQSLTVQATEHMVCTDPLGRTYDAKRTVSVSMARWEPPS